MVSSFGIDEDYFIAEVQQPAVTVTPSPDASSPTSGFPIASVLTPQVLMIMLILGGLAVLQLFEGSELRSNSTTKNAKARAKWAGLVELKAARTLAVKQINGRARKSACVYIIKPKVIQYPESVLKRRKVKRKDGTLVDSTWTPAPELGSIPTDVPVVIQGEKHSFQVSADLAGVYGVPVGTTLKTETVWVPDTQRSVMVVGAPGSGKTFSAIDPMIRSVVEQGYPMVLYDFKYPAQTSTIAWYAQQLGYKIHVFAPGFPESDVLNLLDFLSGDPEDDASKARQLASTLNKNFSLGQKGGGDRFFEDAGDQLIQAVLMLAKQTQYPDLMMVSRILAAPELPKRLMGSGTINPWIKSAFDQFLSVADSEKTAASIIGTATLNFTRLMMAKILACIIGKTTLPLDLNGKQMVVFGLDREIRDVVAPIVATAITMIINRNLFRQGGRKDPLFCVFDELPTIYLDRLVNWENESRSDGFNGIIGYQNKSQLEKIYGKEMSLAIMGGCATKFIFNPGEYESAEYFSKFFGDEEIVRKNSSRSSSSGKGGSSTSETVEVSTRKLISPEELTGLPPGTCYMTNPQYANQDMAYLPRRIQVILPPWELKLAEIIEQQWYQVHTRLLGRAKQFHQVPNEEDVQVRVQEFDATYPIPVTENAPSAVDLLSGLF